MYLRGVTPSKAQLLSLDENRHRPLPFKSDKARFGYNADQLRRSLIGMGRIIYGIPWKTAGRHLGIIT